VLPKSGRESEGDGEMAMRRARRLRWASAVAFSVAIVPHTWQATVCRFYRPGSEVNLEVDLIARYLERLVQEAR